MADPPASPSEQPNENEELPAPIHADQRSADPEGDPDPEPEPSELLPFLIVGIGASAGGVQAYIDLFNNLAPDTGMAFVVVQHLAPDQKSRLRDILALHTSMTVAELYDPVRPEPNHVYVLPPNSFVKISHGVLILEPRPAELRVPMPIDYFFRALAFDQKTHAIGVVLSGMDSDGALGLKTIKGEGGISIVQEPSSALFPSMPQNSIAADHVDIVVPPSRIGMELARIGRQFTNPAVLTLERGPSAAEEGQGLHRIFESLRGVSGVDFTEYKLGTVRRRLARRMILKKMDDLAEYASYLHGHPEEARSLQEDLLINVTRFFRDPEVYENFQQTLIPRLFEGRAADEPIRIWIAGCSTGEEVYSIAMALLEYGDQQSGILFPAISIFGTDASELSIRTARSGVYPEAIETDVSPERLQKFFSKFDKGYQIAKRVRELCIFARQNLCTDPPYSHLDLVSCRNVLIYLASRRQEQLLRTFHYSLRSNGCLILGKAETTRHLSELFSTLDRSNRFYIKIPGGERSGFELWNRVGTPVAQAHQVSQGAVQRKGWSESDLRQAVDRVILTHFDLPAVVVDAQLNIVYTRGRVSPFFEITPGASSLHLLRMIGSPIAIPLRDAVIRAIDEDIPVQAEKVSITDGGRQQDIAIEVLPLHNAALTPRCYLILFIAESENAGLSGARGSALPVTTNGGAGGDVVTQLRNDLASTKRYMQSLVEERDAKNQELISTSEEVLSQNEELQSANEELETTKEEIQSSNEELHTVNDELQRRNTMLTEAGNDLNNLLSSVNLPVLMLNNEMQIRQFTPAAQRLISVRPSDIGRPIREIRLNLSIDDVQPIVAEVLETLVTKEIEIQDNEKRWHLLRVRPYRTNDNRIEGAVLLLLDIDESRRIQQALRDARDFSRAIIENVRVAIAILDEDFRIRNANSSFKALLAENVDVEGRSFPDLAKAQWGISDVTPYLENILQSRQGAEFSLERLHYGADDESITMRGIAVNADSERVLLMIVEDITIRQQAEKRLADERNNLKEQVAVGELALEHSQDALRALTGKLFISQEEERRRVARELHDDLVQKLALIHMSLDQFAVDLPQDEMRRRLEALRKQAATVTDEARQMSHKLHPAILDDLGLAIALKSLTQEFGDREDMLVEFVNDSMEEAIPRGVAASLYRVAQEALRNIAKHAGKTHVKVSLQRTDTGIRMEVLDFGKGFNVADARGGLGLISMVERARLVGGVVTVESSLGRGTVIRVDVSLKLKRNLNQKFL